MISKMLPAARFREEAGFQFRLCIRVEQQTQSDDLVSRHPCYERILQGFPFAILVSRDSGNYL